MVREPRVNARETLAALRRAGFGETHQTGSHVVMLDAARRRTAIVPQHSGHDLPLGTLHSILHQAGLTVEEFIALLK